MLDIPDSFISSSAAAKKGLTTTLGKEEGLIMNPQTNDVYIYSSHDKKKGVYLIDTLEDQNPSPSPSTSEAQLKKISEELLTLHICLGHQGVEAMRHVMKTKALLNAPDEKVDEAI